MNKIANYLYKNWKKKVFYIYFSLLLFIILKIGINTFYKNFGNSITLIEFYRDFTMSYFLFYFTLVYLKIKDQKKQLNTQSEIVKSRLSQMEKNIALKEESNSDFKVDSNDLKNIKTTLTEISKDEEILETMFLYLTLFTALLTFLPIIFK